MKLRHAAFKLAHGEPADEPAGTGILHGHARLRKFARLDRVPVAGVESLQHLRVAYGNRSLAYEPLHFFGEIEQGDRIRNGGTAFLADTLGDFLVGKLELVLQRAESNRLVDGIQIVALEILSDGHHGGGRVVNVLHHHRNKFQPGLVRGALAPLAADKLQFSVLAPTAGERLDDAVLANGLHQVFQSLAAELRARLPWRTLYLPRRNLQHGLARRSRRRRRDKRHDRRRRSGRRRGRRGYQRVKPPAHPSEAAVLLLRLHCRSRGRLCAGRLFQERVGGFLHSHGFSSQSFSRA